ncbi:MAG: hypothetical protein WCQ53_02330 [bacterium]
MKKTLLGLVLCSMFSLSVYAQQNPTTPTNPANGFLLTQKVLIAETLIVTKVSMWDKDGSKTNIKNLLDLTGYSESYAMFSLLVDESLNPVATCTDIKSRITTLLTVSFPRVKAVTMVRGQSSVEMSADSLRDFILTAIKNSEFAKLKTLCTEAEQQAFSATINLLTK